MTVIVRSVMREMRGFINRRSFIEIVLFLYEYSAAWPAPYQSDNRREGIRSWIYVSGKPQN